MFAWFEVCDGALEVVSAHQQPAKAALPYYVLPGFSIVMAEGHVLLTSYECKYWLDTGE